MRRLDAECHKPESKQDFVFTVSKLVEAARR
jgi:hypothetical protein